MSNTIIYLQYKSCRVESLNEDKREWEREREREREKSLDDRLWVCATLLYSVCDCNQYSNF
jgi:arginyl-tRNA synthetase